MNTSGDSDGTECGNDFAAERERLYQEIHTVREQRNALQTELSKCRTQNLKLSGQLGAAHVYATTLEAQRDAAWDRVRELESGSE